MARHHDEDDNFSVFHTPRHIALLQYLPTPARYFAQDTAELEMRLRPEPYVDRVTRGQSKLTHLVRKPSDYENVRRHLLRCLREDKFVSVDTESTCPTAGQRSRGVTPEMVYILFGTLDCNAYLFDLRALRKASRRHSATAGGLLDPNLLQALSGCVCVGSAIDDQDVMKLQREDITMGIPVDLRNLYMGLQALGAFKGLGGRGHQPCKSGVAVWCHQLLGYHVKPMKNAGYAGVEEYERVFEPHNYEVWPAYRYAGLFYQFKPDHFLSQIEVDHRRLYMSLDAWVPVLLARRAVEYAYVYDLLPCTEVFQDDFMRAFGELAVRDISRSMETGQVTRRGLWPAVSKRVLPSLTKEDTFGDRCRADDPVPDPESLNPLERSIYLACLGLPSSKTLKGGQYRAQSRLFKSHCSRCGSTKKHKAGGMGGNCQRLLDPPCLYPMCEVEEDHVTVTCVTLHTRCKECGCLGHGPNAKRLCLCQQQRRLRAIFEAFAPFGAHTKNKDVLGW